MCTPDSRVSRLVEHTSRAVWKLRAITFYRLSSSDQEGLSGLQDVVQMS